MSIKFCNICDNRFKSIEEEGILYNACHTCGNKVISKSLVVSKSMTRNTNKYSHNPFSIYDTLARTNKIKCPKCDTVKEVVITKNTYNMQDIYICCDTECNHYWGYE